MTTSKKKALPQCPPPGGVVNNGRPARVKEHGGAKSSGEHGRRSRCEGGCSGDDADRWWLTRFLRKNAFSLFTRDDHSKKSEALGVARTTRGGGRGWNWWLPGRRGNSSRASSAGRGNKNKSRLPAGLKNQGNTCYLNSLLQSLYHAPGFKQAVFEAAEAAEGGATVSALAKVLRELDKGGRPASTLPLTEAMGLDPRVQEDAQEFGRLLFNKLETECEEEPDAKKESPDQGRGCRSERKKVLRKRIHEIFGGRLENYIECVDVPFSKEDEEVFYDLPVVVKGSWTLEKALNRFTEAELLAGGNEWQAGEHGPQRARKGMRFVQFPGVLQFQLKRFEFNPFRGNLAKVNDRFEFPANLDALPWLRDSPVSSAADRSGRYRLSSVVMHAGTPTYGHYYAYVRHGSGASLGSTGLGSGAASPTGIGEGQGARWVKLDDQRVSDVSEMEVMKDAFGGRGGLRDGRRKPDGGRRYSTLGFIDLLEKQVGGVPSDGSTASAYMLQYVRDDMSSS